MNTSDMRDRLAYLESGRILQRLHTTKQPMGVASRGWKVSVHVLHSYRWRTMAANRPDEMVGVYDTTSTREMITDDILEAWK